MSVNLVIQNGAKYVPFVILSLKNQTFKDFEMIVVDNGSTDGTIDVLQKELLGSNIDFRIIQNKENAGFALGHNQAYKETRTPYFVLLNVDTFMLPDVFEKMVAFLDMHADTAAVAPRLMRWNFEISRAQAESGYNLADAARQGFTSYIDAIGIRLFRNRRAVEWLTRYEWAKDSLSVDIQKIYEKPVLEVFGVSGAFAGYRKSVIDKALLPETSMFDPTYHSYKEDLDLAYRLRNCGYVSYVLLTAVVYHDRTGAGPMKMSDFAAAQNKTRQSFFVRFYSYINHLRTLYKNEYWQNFLIDFPFIFIYEFKKFFYILFTDPRLIFKGLLEIISNRKFTKEARQSIKRSRRLYWKGLRRWWL